MMRRAMQGVCIDCAAVEFLQQLDNMHGGKLLQGHTWVEALGLPHMREQFANLMRAGNADAGIDEIDWDRVAQLWDIAPAVEGKLF